ncbi:MAG: dehalogenase [Dehalogenimonas sp.]
MQYFLLFAFVGAILAVSLILLINWLRSRNISLKWYEWATGILGTVLLLTAIQHFFGAMSELFSYAAWIGLLILGLPALILLTLTWQLVNKRTKQA